MVVKTTQGIQISVKTHYEGRYQNKGAHIELFSYEVSIENKSEYTVQLLNRQWYIYDSLNHLSEVQGEGVVGKQPVLEPGAIHEYQSGCHLVSTVGAMRGFYEMKRLADEVHFDVEIPTFQLIAPHSNN